MYVSRASESCRPGQQYLRKVGMCLQSNWNEVCCTLDCSSALGWHTRHLLRPRRLGHPRSPLRRIQFGRRLGELNCPWLIHHTVLHYLETWECRTIPPQSGTAVTAEMTRNDISTVRFFRPFLRNPGDDFEFVVRDENVCRIGATRNFLAIGAMAESLEKSARPLNLVRNACSSNGREYAFLGSSFLPISDSQDNLLSLLARLRN